MIPDRVALKIAVADGHWLWVGAVDRKGYGIFGKGRRGTGNHRAHRYMWEEFCGPIPRGSLVCHRCDVPSCCNPRHLFIGSPADNSSDMVKKGRSSKGSSRPLSKLTEFDVAIARAMVRDGLSVREVANAMNVSVSTMRSAVTGKTWKHVPQDVIDMEVSDVPE